MTTSTSSSASRLSLLAAAALVAGCGGSDVAAKAPDAPAEPKPAAPARKADVAALYTTDLARAVAGEKKVPFAATAAFGGMACTPGALSGKDAASRRLTLTLPADPAARRHVLAVVTPERGLLEVYSPYGEASEAEDVVVPSQAISWAKAREQRRFDTGTDALDGLRPGSDTPEPLFIEPGRYRFALVNGIDAALLKANGTSVRATAGCSFDWTP